MKRPVDLVVISDVHLGTRACRASALNAYLKSINPRRLILCGDIIDLWHISAGGWSVEHTKVVRRLLKMSMHGIEVRYITGNHDEALRRFAPFAAGSIHLCRDWVLEENGQRTWFVHGDIADTMVGTNRLLAWIGSHSYDGLEWLGGTLNRIRALTGRPPMSLNALIKHRLATAQAHIARFQSVMADLAEQRGYDAVVCGHIHIPCLTTYAVKGRTIDYRNSGDWVESCTALEYDAGSWRLMTWTDQTGLSTASPSESERHDAEELLVK